jgi:hypothetical protein
LPPSCLECRSNAGCQAAVWCHGYQHNAMLEETAWKESRCLGPCRLHCSPLDFSFCGEAAVTRPLLQAVSPDLVFTSLYCTGTMMTSPPLIHSYMPIYRTCSKYRCCWHPTLTLRAPSAPWLTTDSGIQYISCRTLLAFCLTLPHAQQAGRVEMSPLGSSLPAEPEGSW